MSETTSIGWVQPATPIRGLDHLGVQAPCIALYGQLLPGITNVTDRARYYSFHPWLVRSFEQRYQDHSINEFQRVVRKAECLFALAAIRHARVLGEDDSLHGSGMVGRLSLLRIPDTDAAFALDDYAGLTAPHRYFKNKLGGLGQYYMGPLRDLRVLDYTSDGKGASPGYDRERGVALAEAFDAGVPGDDFFQLLEKAKIRWSDLDDLADFCPCKLRHSEIERPVLLDLFLARSEMHQVPEALNRRATLFLVLDLVGRCTRLEGYDLESVFRASTYGRSLPDGTPWAVPSSLARVQRGWAAYERNELLSISLQALFAAVLGSIECDRSGRLPNSAMAGDVCVALLRSSVSYRERRVADVVEELRSGLPPLGNWMDDSHEIQRGWRILEAGVERDALPVLVEEGLQVLLALLARERDGNPYAEFEFEPDHFDAREIHLLSFGQAWRSIWHDMTVEEWVKWLVVKWGVQRHLNVALRKLRSER